MFNFVIAPNTLKHRMTKTQYLILILFFISKLLLTVSLLTASPVEKDTPRRELRNLDYNSVLSEGNWVKISTSGCGIYKIKYSMLESWGFTNPEAVGVYGNGGFMLSKVNAVSLSSDLMQNAIWHAQDGNGEDCLFFYSTGTIRWTFNEQQNAFTHQSNDYADKAVYYLSDQGPAKLVELVDDDVVVLTDTVSQYADYQLYEQDLENLIQSGRDWYGDRFQPGRTINYSFPIKNSVADRPVNVLVKAAGRSSGSSSFSVLWNGNRQQLISFQGVDTGSQLTEYARSGQTRFSVYSGLATSVVGLTYNSSNSSALGWLDYIELNCWRRLEYEDDPLFFRNPETVGEGRGSLYQIEGLNDHAQVWDITDYLNARHIRLSWSGNTATFVAASDSLREFVVFDPTGEIPEPQIVGPVDNQNLHGLTVPGMLILCHADFRQQADELALFHEQHQLSAAVVDVEQIYNEFSSGIADVAGIRNFIRYCYEKSKQTTGDLKYVLLFGDGSYDSKDVSGQGFNFIPTYQSANSLLPTSSFVTDDFYVLLEVGEGEAEGSMDLAIGRIPAQTTTEAEAVVSKIIRYSSEEAMGEWRNVICFIGDDEDSNIHAYQAENLAENVVASQPAFVVDKIYFDAFEQQTSPSGETYPDVTSAINGRVKKGTLILNYTGHANEIALAEEKVLTTDEIDAWTNENKLPVFITATCEFSRFDADEQSGGEHILFNANGGAVALFSTTRIVYSSPNYVLNSQLYKHFFQVDDQGQYLAMGEVVRRTKNALSSGINKRNFMLLGDPAMRLAIPVYNVVTTSVNGLPPTQISEPIAALTKVEVEGEVTDNDGNRLTNFNGQLIPVVYDKARQTQTLGNDGEEPFEYISRNNPIYKGLATVENGKFAFSFLVPKDVSYAEGTGKIVYYAYSAELDAHGATTDLPIGASTDSSLDDSDGPQIGLYLNTSSFESGDQVGANSILYLDLFDRSGINTLGTGIGHDITAVLDGDYSNIIVLNDYYLAGLDDYTSGSVVYPLTGLEEGEHTLTVKVWDVFNNLTEITVRFVVSEALSIQDVVCYPNPMSDQANFRIIHNQPDELLDVRIEFFDSKGSVVDILEKSLVSNGVETPVISWRLSDRQLMVRNGSYFYRVILKNTEGAQNSQSGTIIILRR